MFENVKFRNTGKFITHGEWKHPQRIIDSYEAIFVTKGEVFINENGVDYHVKEEEAIVLFPGLEHYGYKYSSETEFFWVHWYVDKNITPNIKHLKIDNAYGLTLYFRQLISSRFSINSSESADYLTRLILIELHNNQHQSSNSLVERIAAFIRTNSYLGLTAKQVASLFKYNPDYLNRLFKSHFSKSIKEYIDESRINLIKSLLLQQKMTLAEVSAKSGFSDYKLFLKFFKYHEKITPSEFCRQYSKTFISPNNANK